MDLILPGLALPIQPDVIFVATKHLDLVKERFVEGILDLVVEVLSLMEFGDRRRQKIQTHARAGVREYWIIDSDERTIELYHLQNKEHKLLGKHKVEDNTRSKVLPGFEVKVEEIGPA